jgi:serine/threonine protein kinase
MQRLQLHDDHTRNDYNDRIATDQSWMMAGALPEERFNEVEYASPPLAPLEFPAPTIHCAQRNRHAFSYVNHINQQVVLCTDQTFLVPLATAAQHGHTQRGYLFKRKALSKSSLSALYVCVVLQRRENAMQQADEEASTTVNWVSTDKLVVVKVSSWARHPQQTRGSTVTTPNNEAAAMQHIGNYHPNVLGCIEFLRYGYHLYTVMPYCPGGDLYHKILEGPENNKTIRHHSEGQARIWFRQLLLGLAHLQKKGVCHGAISLENILLNENEDLVIADFGLALRVPYTQLNNSLGIADVSGGSLRRLIKPQHDKKIKGATRYMSPELSSLTQAFDGYAADLWSTAVVLFILLVGWAPFRLAKDTDAKYVQIAMRGKLRQLLWNSNVHHVSPEAINLLQSMLRHDARKRLSLADVMTHPWVTKFTEQTKHPPPLYQPPNYVATGVSMPTVTDSSLPLQRPKSTTGLLAQTQNILLTTFTKRHVSSNAK